MHKYLFSYTLDVIAEILSIIVQNLRLLSQKLFLIKKLPHADKKNID